jgi:mycoredoxin
MHRNQDLDGAGYTKLTTSPMLTIYTTTRCPDCRVAKSILEGAGVSFSELDLDRNPEAVEVVLAINGGFRTVPTIVFSDGQVLVEPGAQELLAAVRSKNPTR